MMSQMVTRIAPYVEKLHWSINNKIIDRNDSTYIFYRVKSVLHYVLLVRLPSTSDQLKSLITETETFSHQVFGSNFL